MSKSIREITKSQKKRSDQTGEPVLVRIQPQMMDALDRFRTTEAGLPSRPEAIRRLVEKALSK